MFNLYRFLNLENIGMAHVKLRLIREDEGQIYALSIELKPHNKVHGPFFLSKEDIKTLFRDIILTTNLDRLKKGQERHENTSGYFMIERIAKLLVSPAEVVDAFISKEIMLKLLRPMFASNIVIKKQ